MEKEVVFKENISETLFQPSAVNSEVEVIMDICDNMKIKLKNVSKIMLYKDIKDLLKETITEIEKIKIKVAHKQENPVVMDPNIDDEDKEYIEQMCLDTKLMKKPTIKRTLTNINDYLESPLRTNVQNLSSLLS